MGKVLAFVPKQVKVSVMQPTQGSTGDPNMDVLVSDDILKLQDKAGVTPEEAIKLATDFYNSYPFLLEYVRGMNTFGGGN